MFNALEATTYLINWIRSWFAVNGPDSYAVIGVSGGKDSSVVAAVCAKALGPDRVIGVMLPNGAQADINDSREVINLTGIHGVEFNIKDATRAMYYSLQGMRDIARKVGALDIPTQQAEQNLPPRVRMAALYLVSQCVNGRVSCNCNASEKLVGYSTLYGDSAGDFAPLACFTASEVVQIGLCLGLPERLVKKTPADGLCGKTDEDNLGFTYEQLDAFIRGTAVLPMHVIELIMKRVQANAFKQRPIAACDYSYHG